MNPYAAPQTQVAPHAVPAAPAPVAPSNVPKQEKDESIPEPSKKPMLSDR